MEKKSLYLIDAMALIYRSYFALNKNPRINSKGLNTSAVLGFFNSLLDILQKHSPTHLAVCFDMQGGSFRNEEYAEYKANREAMPEDLRESIPYIDELLSAMNIKTVGIEGFEADDVIGTLAKKGKKQGFQVYMVTPDKDYAQLVEDDIFILKLPYMGSSEQIWDVNHVLEKFEIKRPTQVIDILGLWGDSSDNIPGVKGIGEKKAKALLQQFDSIEEILANTDKIETKSVRKAIEENKDAAILSKQLATIRLDVPIELIEEDYKVKKPNFTECKRLFDFLEFRKFTERFFKYYSSDQTVSSSITEKTETELDTISSQTSSTTENSELNLFSSFSTFENISNRNNEYEEVDIKQSHLLEQIKQEILSCPYFSFSVKYDGDIINSKLLGISLCCAESKSYYFNLQKDLLSYHTTENEKEFNSFLYDVFCSDNEITKVCYDLKHSKNVLKNIGIEIVGNCFDIQLAHYLINSEERGNLDDLSQIYLNYEMLFPTKNNTPIDRDIYCEKADVVFRLYPLMKEKVEEEKLSFLLNNIELPLVDVLLDMEREGIRLDKKVLKNYSDALQEEKQSLEEKIYVYAGEKFNIASPKQLGEILFEKLDITEGRKVKKTKNKQYSTAEQELEKLSAYHPIIPLILEWRKVSKLKNTYIDALPLLVNPKTDKIHTSFNQAITATGRLSSTNPNLQNIPIRTEMGKEIRRAFVPSKEGNYLLSADYSQIELRIIASLSEDEHLCQAFRDGKDIHQAIAAKIYHIPEEEVTKYQRSSAKSVNFGIIYGISAFGLAEDLHIPRKEAQSLIDEYFSVYPKIKMFIENRILFAQKHGYAETLLGRKRWLKNINSSNGNLRAFDNRNAVNMTIQGTSADMIKIAMVNIYRLIKEKGLESKMILQIHDELVFDVPEKEIDIMQKLVAEQMQQALPLKNVPIVVQPSFGKNLLEIH
ncbi:MAG: DNA polymerase I [Bacteroidales bacterium]|nr:DNA polymerase I [Bacteroidales bacterium]